jgi:hypothetical protein
MTFLEKLAALKIEMPNAPDPVANYINVKQVGSQIFVSGQLSTKNGVLIKGQMGDGTTIEAGYEAAKSATLNIFVWEFLFRRHQIFLIIQKLQTVHQIL